MKSIRQGMRRRRWDSVAANYSMILWPRESCSIWITFSQTRVSKPAPKLGSSGCGGLPTVGEGTWHGHSPDLSEGAGAWDTLAGRVSWFVLGVHHVVALLPWAANIRCLPPCVNELFLLPLTFLNTWDLKELQSPQLAPAFTSSQAAGMYLLKWESLLTVMQLWWGRREDLLFDSLCRSEGNDPLWQQWEEHTELFAKCCLKLRRVLYPGRCPARTLSAHAPGGNQFYWKKWISSSIPPLIKTLMLSGFAKRWSRHSFLPFWTQKQNATEEENGSEESKGWSRTEACEYFVFPE